MHHRYHRHLPCAAHPQVFLHSQVRYGDKKTTIGRWKLKLNFLVGPFESEELWLGFHLIYESGSYLRVSTSSAARDWMIRCLHAEAVALCHQVIATGLPNPPMVGERLVTTVGGHCEIYVGMARHAAFAHLNRSGVSNRYGNERQDLGI